MFILNYDNSVFKYKYTLKLLFKKFRFGVENETYIVQNGLLSPLVQSEECAQNHVHGKNSSLELKRCYFFLASLSLSVLS